jgi:uncharacterized protein YecE (DUF72 family)
LKSWYRRTPKTFSFAVKGSRFITHIKRINNVKEPLKLFFGRAGLLKEKLSAVLWQFPPKFGADVGRLQNFLNDLKKNMKCRHAFEFRHKTWFSDRVFEVLRKSGSAVCSADWPDFAGDVPVTGDFTYVRRHGTGDSLYSGNYSDDCLRRDARLIKSWLSQGKDTYIYFNNDACGYAVRNAMTLSRLLKNA